MNNQHFNGPMLDSSQQPGGYSDWQSPHLDRQHTQEAGNASATGQRRWISPVGVMPPSAQGPFDSVLQGTYASPPLFRGPRPDGHGHPQGWGQSQHGSGGHGSQSPASTPQYWNTMHGSPSGPFETGYWSGPQSECTVNNISNVNHGNQYILSPFTPPLDPNEQLFSRTHDPFGTSSLFGGDVRPDPAQQQPVPHKHTELSKRKLTEQDTPGSKKTKTAEIRFINEGPKAEAKVEGKKVPRTWQSFPDENDLSGYSKTSEQSGGKVPTRKSNSGPTPQPTPQRRASNLHHRPDKRGIRGNQEDRRECVQNTVAAETHAEAAADKAHPTVAVAQVYETAQEPNGNAMPPANAQQEPSMAPSRTDKPFSDHDRNVDLDSSLEGLTQQEDDIHNGIEAGLENGRGPIQMEQQLDSSRAAFAGGSSFEDSFLSPSQRWLALEHPWGSLPVPADPNMRAMAESSISGPPVPEDFITWLPGAFDGTEDSFEPSAQQWEDPMLRFPASSSPEISNSANMHDADLCDKPFACGPVNDS